MKDIVEAMNWIIKNNYDIQCLLRDGDLKEVLIQTYLAGKDSMQEDFSEDIEQAIDDRLEEDDLISLSTICVENI